MLLWLVFCAMAGTGLLLAFRLPPGFRGGAGLAVMGWTRHQWGDLHTWLSYAFLGLIAVGFRRGDGDFLAVLFQVHNGDLELIEKRWSSP